MRVSHVLKNLANVNRGLFFIGVTSTILTSFSVLVLGYVAKLVINAIGVGDQTAVRIGITWLIASTLCLCIFSFFRSFAMNLLAEQFCQKKQEELYNLVLNSTLKSVTLCTPQALIAIITGEFKRVRTILGTSFPFLIRSSITFLGSVSIITYISPKLTAIIVFAIAGMMYPALLIGKIVKVRSKNIDGDKSRIERRIFDAILNLKLVKSSQKEAFELKFYQQENAKLLKQEKNRLIIRSIFISLCIFAVVSGIVLAIVFGAKMVIDGNLSGGQLGSFMIYSIMIALGLGGISEHGMEFANLKKSLAKIKEVTNSLEGEGTKIGVNIEKFESLEVKNFDFMHKADEMPVSLLIPAFNAKIGDIIVLQSPSGSGKTTFFDLLMKFHDTKQESILINGIDIRQISASSIRKASTYFAQDSVIINSTLLENIIYGKDTNIYEILPMLKELNLEHLQDRVETDVASTKLSGGEKTRIGIIRTILRNDATLVIFDEPTTGLDTKNIHAVCSLIDIFGKNRIIIIASHDQEILNHLPKERTKIISIPKDNYTPPYTKM